MPSRHNPLPFRSYLFGLDVVSSIPILGARSGARVGTPRVTLRKVSDEELAQAWRPADAATVIDERTRNGRPFMSVHSHPELGYRIAVPRYGRHVVSTDGRDIRSVLPAVPPWQWYRLLFAQVLPISATLNGHTVFHASAVEADDRALALVAPSGRGKSSVAMHLVARGAAFVTDDALALEATSDGIVAHPGGGMSSLHVAELREVSSQSEGRFGEVLGRSDKVHLAIPPVERALRLGAVYFLRRAARARARSLRIVESRPASPLQLLSSSFVTHLGTPEYLATHLDVCARIAQSVPVYEVRVPDSAVAHEVASAVAAHASS